jgi:hypothetical protein
MTRGINSLVTTSKQSIRDNYGNCIQERQYQNTNYLKVISNERRERHRILSCGIGDLPITLIHVEVDFKLSLAPLSGCGLIFETSGQEITQYLVSTSVAFAAPAR